MPSWNIAIVCLAGIAAEPSIRPGEVDGQEAGAVRGVGDAEGQRDDASVATG